MSRALSTEITGKWPKILNWDQKGELVHICGEELSSNISRIWDPNSVDSQIDWWPTSQPCSLPLLDMMYKRTHFRERHIIYRHYELYTDTTKPCDCEVPWVQELFAPWKPGDYPASWEVLPNIDTKAADFAVCRRVHWLLWRTNCVLHFCYPKFRRENFLRVWVQ